MLSPGTDASGFTDAGAWGDILTFAAQKAGITGLVINGAVRDAKWDCHHGIPSVRQRLVDPRYQQALKGNAWPARQHSRHRR
jgi:regulator of RNase E activity RraA